MPDFLISYYTQNTYSEAMKQALLEFLILPADCEYQERFSYNLDVSPYVEYHQSKNSFGFDTLQFRLKGQQSVFNLKLTCCVRKEEYNPFEFIPISLEDERTILNSDNFAIDNYPFCQESRLTALPTDFDYPVIGSRESIFDFIQRVNSFVCSTYQYKISDKNLHRTIDQVLKDGHGVCQDFAHIMLAILRKNNIPARYVSGYLNQGQQFIGDAAVHAWIQALIPGVGWIGFDPTNNLLEDYHYIKIAHGLDIDDCQNVKGVVTGPGKNDTSYSVLVEEQNKKENQ